MLIWYMWICMTYLSIINKSLTQSSNKEPQKQIHFQSWAHQETLCWTYVNVINFKEWWLNGRWVYCSSKYLLTKSMPFLWFGNQTLILLLSGHPVLEKIRNTRQLRPDPFGCHTCVHTRKHRTKKHMNCFSRIRIAYKKESFCL